MRWGPPHSCIFLHLKEVYQIRVPTHGWRCSLAEVLSERSLSFLLAALKTLPCAHVLSPRQIWECSPRRTYKERKVLQRVWLWGMSMFSKETECHAPGRRTSSSFLIFNIQQTESIHSVVTDNGLEICEMILAWSLTNHKKFKRNKFSWKDRTAIG